MKSKLVYPVIKLAIITVSVCLCSCSRLMDFTVVSTKNVNLNVKKDAPRVTGKGFQVKDAIDRAIEKAGPGYDALIDGVIYQGVFRYKVTGTPIKTSEQKEKKE